MTTLMAAVAKAAAAEDEEDKKDDEEEMAATSAEDEEKEDEDEMTDKAVKAERARILGIQSMAFSGQDKLVSKLIADGVSLGDAAIALNQDHKSKAAKHIAALDADEAKVKNLRAEANDAIPRAAVDPTAGLTGEAKWKAEFAASEDLRKEFASEGAYVSFMRAKEAGRVRILARPNAA